MRSTFFLVIGLLLVVGFLFARERLRLAFKIGSILYFGVLIFRFAVFTHADPDNLLDLATILAVFGALWLAAWGATTLVLRYRKRRLGDET